MTMTLILALVFLQGIPHYGHCIGFTQPGSMVVNPGQSLSISCKVSGYSLTESRYATHWIRQPAGKALEWIGRYWIGNGNVYEESLRNKFTISTDTSNHTMSLQGSNLQTGDTAVYYCARESWRKYYFDYWGKGTQVTVVDASAPPSVFLLLPCTTSGSSSITLGCLFQRPSASSTFSWHQDGNQLSDKGTSHPNIFTNGMFLQINTLTLPRASWKEDSEYFCKAGTDSNNMKKNKEKDPVSPTVSLLPVSSGDSTPDALICVIRDFYPKTLTVNWKVNSRDQTGSITWQPEKQAPGVYSASSILKVDRTKWDSSEEYTCEVEHQQQNFSQKTSKNMLVEKTCLEVTLKPPRVREMFINNKAVLDCDITGEEQAAVEGATVTWRVDGTEKSEVNTTSVAKQVGHLYRKTSTLTLRQTDWFDGKRVQCSVQQSSDKPPINKDISMGQKNSESPTVLILIPTEKELNGKSDLTLACVVTGTSLKDVYTMWKVDEGEHQEGMTGQPLRSTDGTYSITSLLRITAAQWKKHSFTCAIKCSTAENLSAPVQATVSREMVQCRLSQFGFSKSCNEEGDEDDELGSLWSTASSFIILFLCTVFYNVILSLIKLKK